MRKAEHGGMPWRQLFDNVDEGNTEGKIKGVSGELLIYTYEKDEHQMRLLVKDERRPYFHANFEADLLGDYFTLDLHTKGDGKDDQIRHPDLRGGEFIGYSLKLMRHQIGYTSGSFIGVWCNEQGYNDNFKKFMDEYKKGMSEAEAAKRTWSGRTVALHGFTKVRDRDIEFDPTGTQIIAKFHRPT